MFSAIPLKQLAVGKPVLPRLLQIFPKNCQITELQTKKVCQNFRL